MNETIPSFDCSKRVRKRYKTYKPYWNDHLEALWKDMRQKERAFTKYTQNNYVKRNLLCRFKVARNTFDKVLRNTERAYRRDLSIDIETACTDDPRKFWDHLLSLGPKRKQDTPFEVYDEHRTLILSVKNGQPIFLLYTISEIRKPSLIINFMTKYSNISDYSKKICLTRCMKKIPR